VHGAEHAAPGDDHPCPRRHDPSIVNFELV
jgi:hypothetical protein